MNNLSTESKLWIYSDFQSSPKKKNLNHTGLSGGVEKIRVWPNTIYVHIQSTYLCGYLLTLFNCTLHKICSILCKKYVKFILLWKLNSNDSTFERKLQVIPILFFLIDFRWLLLIIQRRYIDNFPCIHLLNWILLCFFPIFIFEKIVSAFWISFGSLCKEPP